MWRIRSTSSAIDAFAKYECAEDVKKVLENLEKQSQVSKLIKVYTQVCHIYAKTYMQQKNVDYIKMIKSDIDYTQLKNCHDQTESAYAFFAQ